MNQLDIKYYKWVKKEYKNFYKSLRNILEMKEIQFYMPFFSLYFYIHNTTNSQKIIDLYHRYYIHEVFSIVKERYYNSNKIIEARIFDNHKNIYENKVVFCKSIPILDPIHCINNNYNLINKNNFQMLFNIEGFL